MKPLTFVWLTELLTTTVLFVLLGEHAWAGGTFATLVGTLYVVRRGMRDD